MIQRETDIVLHKFGVISFPGNKSHGAETEIPEVLFLFDANQVGLLVDVPVNGVQLPGKDVFVEIQLFVVVASPHTQLEIRSFFFAKIASPRIGKSDGRRFDESPAFVAVYEIEADTVIVVGLQVTGKKMVEKFPSNLGHSFL